MPRNLHIADAGRGAGSDHRVGTTPARETGDVKDNGCAHALSDRRRARAHSPLSERLIARYHRFVTGIQPLARELAYREIEPPAYQITRNRRSAARISAGAKAARNPGRRQGVGAVANENLSAPGMRSVHRATAGRDPPQRHNRQHDARKARHSRYHDPNALTLSRRNPYPNLPSAERGSQHEGLNQSLFWQRPERRTPAIISPTPQSWLPLARRVSTSRLPARSTKCMRRLPRRERRGRDDFLRSERVCGCAVATRQRSSPAVR